MKDKRVKSAEIIQKNFRKYLERRKLSCNKTDACNAENKKSSNENEHPCKNIGESLRNEVSTTPQQLQEIQKQIHEIYIELNKFYTNLPACNENLNQQDDLSQDINRIIANLSNISKLDDCGGVNVEHVTPEARLKHDEALNNLNVKWWQNLN